MKSVLKGKNKGSSTVLVILMIVLLVSLAVLSVGISNSGYKLSLRMGEQFREYYHMESEAERVYSEILRMSPDQITEETLKLMGLFAPAVRENVCSFQIHRNGRRFLVELDLLETPYRILSWREAEQIFEIKELEISTFD